MHEFIGPFRLLSGVQKAFLQLNLFTLVKPVKGNRFIFFHHSLLFNLIKNIKPYAISILMWFIVENYYQFSYTVFLFKTIQMLTARNKPVSSDIQEEIIVIFLFTWKHNQLINLSLSIPLIYLKLANFPIFLTQFFIYLFQLFYLNFFWKNELLIFQK